VTLYVKRHPLAFASVRPDAPARIRRPDLRLTVDTADDLGFMQHVLLDADNGSQPAPLPAIIDAADRWLARKAA
jgi:spore coat polysaccharide biosynthesis protein SpsF (cytidylyltransferase family)